MDANFSLALFLSLHFSDSFHSPIPMCWIYFILIIRHSLATSTLFCAIYFSRCAQIVWKEKKSDWRKELGIHRRKKGVG